MAFSEVLLKDLKCEFSKWRMRRKKGQEIPAELWLKAVCLAEMTSVAYISKELMLNHSKLSQRFKNKQKEERGKSPKEIPLDLTFTKFDPVGLEESSSVSVPISRCGKALGKIRFPGGSVLSLSSLDAL
jgi:hypothetical protein